MKKNLGKVLVVDDDPAMRSLLSFRLEGVGYEVDTANSGEQVQALLKTEFPYCLVLLDLMLPDINGIEVLKQLKHEYSQCQVVIITGYPTMKLGIEAIKNGAYDFICKPFEMEQLLKILENALTQHQLKKENTVLRQTLIPPNGFSDLIGKSSAMLTVRELIRQAASSRATVLITGESGTGKEIVAQCIHKNSPFHQGPFIVVNCGAIPMNLVESELFGYEKGSFTGAILQTKGKFELAQNGTIFLDEIGELPLEAQVKLLRVLQEKEIVRLGGDKRIKLNLRVIAATNRVLNVAVSQGTFREDLYYRIALFLIDLPPLSQREGDLMLLARYFLTKYTELEETEPIEFNSTCENYLEKMPWPGNVRQLENCIYRTVLMNRGKSTLTAEDIKFLPFSTLEIEKKSLRVLHGKIIPLDEIEAKVIQEALEITSGNIKETASALKIARGTLYRKIKEYDLDYLVKGKSE